MPRVEKEPDFVDAPRHQNSLHRLMERYPDGAPAHVAARALGLTEERADDLVQHSMASIRAALQESD